MPKAAYKCTGCGHTWPFPRKTCPYCHSPVKPIQPPPSRHWDLDIC